MNTRIHHLGAPVRKPLNPIDSILQNSRSQSSNLSSSFYILSNSRANKTRNENIQQKMIALGNSQANVQRVHPHMSKNEQVVVINNRKFVKSMTPEGPHSPAHRAPQPVLQISRPIQTDLNMKIKLLENRISQLHHQKQIQVMKLMEQNRKIGQQLQKQRRKHNIVPKASGLFTPIKKISQYDEEYFLEHEHRIENMKKRIIELQKSLQNAQKQNKSLHKNNKDLCEQIDSFIKILSSEKQIQTENNLPVQQYDGREKSTSNNLYELKMQEQLAQLQEQKDQLLKQINRLNFEIQMKTDLISQKDSKIQQLVHNKMDLQIDLNKQSRQNQRLQQQLAKLQEQLHLMRLLNKNSEKYEQIPVKYIDQSVSIDFEAIRNQKLRTVSLGQSIIINQNENKQHPKKESFNDDQISEQSFCNILQKMQLLTETNDKILIQNQILNSKISELMQNNIHLKNTLDMAYQSLHRKQLDIDRKAEENSNLKNNIQQLSSMNQSLVRKSVSLGDRALQLELSASYSRQLQKGCTKCRQLVRALGKLKSQTSQVSGTKLGNSTF